MSRRSDLRAQVWDISGGRCEHPVAVPVLVIGALQPTRLPPDVVGRCPMPAAELAHIQPRGHGHTGYRDRLDNVMVACPVHARSTDDLSSPEWKGVPAVPLMTKRQALAHYVNTARRRAGVDVEASDAR